MVPTTIMVWVNNLKVLCIVHKGLLRLAANLLQLAWCIAKNRKFSIYLISAAVNYNSHNNLQLVYFKKLSLACQNKMVIISKKIISKAASSLNVHVAINLVFKFLL